LESQREIYLFAGLTLNLLTTTIVAPPSDASKWQMGFNSVFKGLSVDGKIIYLKEKSSQNKNLSKMAR
jgi:hypothetical protein